MVVDSVNPLAITRAYWRETAASTDVELVEIEVLCSDKREHRRRVDSRHADIRGLALPTWQQILDRRYEPWPTAHVIDTAGTPLEESVSQAEAIMHTAQAAEDGSTAQGRLR